MYTATNTSSHKLSFTEMVSAVFILLFAYSACSKLIRLEHFIVVLKSSPLIGNYATYFAISLIVLESMTVTLLFFPGTRMRGLVLSLILMILFTLYISYILLSNAHLPCSCGGLIEEFTWKEHLVFNLLLTTIALTTVFQHKIFIAISRGNRKPVKE